MSDARVPTWDRGPRQRGNEPILVVEDYEFVRQLACEALKILGNQILSASHPLKAIALCEIHEGRTNLLMTDVVLPHREGRFSDRKTMARKPADKSACREPFPDSCAFEAVARLSPSWM